jgi:hypothetical protein
VDIELEGFDVLSKALQDLVDAMPPAKVRAIMGQVVYDDSQERVPVLTGALKSSGRLTDETVEYLEDYAEHVEFGTSRMAAQSYLRPNDRTVRRIEDALTKEVENAV